MPPRNGQNPRRLAGEGTLEKLTTVSAEGARPTGRISQAKGQSDRAARRAVSGGFSGVAGAGRRLLFLQGAGRRHTMEAVLQLVQRINFYLSDYILVFLLIGTGLYFSVRTRFVQVRCFGEGMRAVFGEFSMRGRNDV